MSYTWNSINSKVKRGENNCDFPKKTTLEKKLCSCQNVSIKEQHDEKLVFLEEEKWCSPNVWTKCPNCNNVHHLFRNPDLFIAEPSIEPFFIHFPNMKLFQKITIIITASIITAIWFPTLCKNSLKRKPLKLKL